MSPVDPREVEEHFNDVASNYDFLNDLLSFGLHRVWKRQLLVWLSPTCGENWIDLCCGTGDLAIILSSYLEESCQITAIDKASASLYIAKRRAKKKSINSINWLEEDALKTNFPDNYFNGAIMAYGLRNLNDPYQAIKELK